MGALTSKLFFKPLVESSPFSRTRTSSVALKMSKVVYEASCWDCQDWITLKKTRRSLQNSKSEHFKCLTNAYHKSALADHVISTGDKLNRTILTFKQKVVLACIVTVKGHC